MKPAVHQYEDKLLELAYGELPAQEANAVESHVRTCARCSDALLEIRAVRSTMGQLPMEPVPDTGLDSLFAYADQAARRNAAGPAPTMTWWRKLMAPLMAAGALSVIGVVAYQSSKDGDVVPSREKVAEAVAANKQDSLTATPIAENAPAPQPVAAAAPLEPAADNKVADKKIANELAKEDASKLALANGAPSKPAAKKMSAGPGDGAELGGLMAKAKASESKNRKAAASDLDRADDQVIADNFGDAHATEYKAAQKGGGKKDAAPAPVQEKEAQEYAQAPGNAGGANARGYVQAEQAKPMAPPPPPLAQQTSEGSGRTSGGGFGLGVGNSTGSTGSSYNYDQRRPVVGSASQAGLGERDSASRAEEAPAVAAAPAQKPQEMRSSFDAQLKAAHAARQSRDTEEEVRIYKSVLDHNASGRERLEALSGICNGLQTLGLVDQATRYCQLLVREFPDSTAARAWVDSQNRNIERQQSAPAKRSKQQYEFSDEAKPSSPPKAEPANAAPANADQKQAY